MVFVTGFGPFGSVKENPSGALARSSGRPFAELPVTFEAVDDFLSKFDPSSFSAVLHIGVAAGSRVMRLETTGRNIIGATADINGNVRGGEITPHAPDLKSSIWTPGDAVRGETRWSNHAGSYLCNYLLYRSLERFPTVRIGFLHVPRFNAMPEPRQQAALARLLSAIEAR